MSSELLLITGATGFTGIKILGLALEAGYNVRAPVRSEAKANYLRSNKFIASFKAEARLETPIVKDITVDGAYDDVIKDVTSVIHVASPVPELAPEQPVPEPVDFTSKLIELARKGTTSILYTALQAPSVKRVVITSSIAAVLPWKYFFRETTDKVFTAKDRAPFVTEYPDGEYEAYYASKVAALAVTEAFIEKEKPHFDIVTLMPAFIFGRNELAETPEDFISNSTNKIAFGQVLGNITDVGPAATCHLDDVAVAHLKAATDLSIPGNTTYLISSGPPGETKIVDALDVVKENFPELVANGTLPCTGLHDSRRVFIDASETERVFGMQFRSYAEAVKDITTQWLELISGMK